MFIGCGSQARNTIGVCARKERSTSASIPCSLDSISLKLPRSKRFCLKHAEDQAVAIVAGLDAVDRGVQLHSKALDVGEGAQSGS
jgi:hypothetical protein